MCLVVCHKSPRHSPSGGMLSSELRCACLCSQLDMLHITACVMCFDHSVQEPDFLQCIWAKLCVSTACNTTNLLTQGVCDDLVREPVTAALVKKLFAEVIAIAAAIGADLPFTAQERLEWAQQRFPACKFSMLQVRWICVRACIGIFPRCAGLAMHHHCCLLPSKALPQNPARCANFKHEHRAQVNFATFKAARTCTLDNSLQAW